MNYKKLYTMNSTLVASSYQNELLDTNLNDYFQIVCDPIGRVTT